MFSSWLFAGHMADLLWIELGWDTLKLSYSGARTDDLKAILEQIYSREESLQNIVIDVNTYQLTVPAWTAYVARPEYLYNDIFDRCVIFIQL